MNNKLLYLLFFLVIISILILYSKKNLEHFYVAIMPNQFIQTNDCPRAGNNLDNYLSAQYQPDNQDLAHFFTFTKDVAAYYPESRRVVNNLYAVPRVI